MSERKTMASPYTILKKPQTKSLLTTQSNSDPLALSLKNYQSCVQAMKDRRHFQSEYKEFIENNFGNFYANHHVRHNNFRNKISCDNDEESDSSDSLEAKKPLSLPNRISYVKNLESSFQHSTFPPIQTPNCNASKILKKSPFRSRQDSGHPDHSESTDQNSSDDQPLSPISISISKTSQTNSTSSKKDKYKRANSLPNKQKRVSFADTCGEQLARIRIVSESLDEPPKFLLRKNESLPAANYMKSYNNKFTRCNQSVGGKLDHISDFNNDQGLFAKNNKVFDDKVNAIFGQYQGSLGGVKYNGNSDSSDDDDNGVDDFGTRKINSENDTVTISRTEYQKLAKQARRQSSASQQNINSQNMMKFIESLAKVKNLGCQPVRNNSFPTVGSGSPDHLKNHQKISNNNNFQTSSPLVTNSQSSSNNGSRQNLALPTIQIPRPSSPLKFRFIPLYHQNLDRNTSLKNLNTKQVQISISFRLEE